MTDFTMSRRDLMRFAAAGAVMLGASACGAGEEKASGGPTKITVWSWTTAAEALRGVVPDFERDNPGIKVDVQDVGNPAIWDKITVGMAAGGKGLADVLHIGVDYLPGYMEKFPGGLANLSKLGADKHKDAFSKGLWPTVTGKDGGAYAMPWEVNPLGLFYRDDYFDKAGVDPESIATWADLIEAGKKIKASTGVFLTGLNKPGTSPDMDLFQNLMQLQGAFYFNMEGKVTLGSPQAVQAMTIIKQLNDAGLLADTAGEGTWKRMMGEGKFAIAPFPAWAAEYLASKFPDQKSKWRVMVPPAVTAGGSRSAIVNSTFLSVAGSSKNQAAAWKFVEYALTKPDAMNKMFKAGGVFPALTAAHSAPTYTEGWPFYGDQPVLKTFVDVLNQGADATNFTGDYAKALKIASDAQTKVLIKGGDPAAVLKEAAGLLAQQTGRQQA
ncbi:ABC transporter substrate-binding protein [Streptosporangium sp. NPDC000396]|uniref:ABC transporter substrate-binding protein n=1 Tax=Streptosporangium sp. NPDC000396 TaxID=3366185 RepID=UPI00368F7752